MTWGIVKKQQDLAALWDHLFLDTAELGFKLSPGCPCFIVVAVVDWNDALSTPKGTWRFGAVYNSQFQLLPHCRTDEYYSDVVLVFCPLPPLCRSLAYTRDLH